MQTTHTHSHRRSNRSPPQKKVSAPHTRNIYSHITRKLANLFQFLVRLLCLLSISLFFYSFLFLLTQRHVYHHFNALRFFSVVTLYFKEVLVPYMILTSAVFPFFFFFSDCGCSSPLHFLKFCVSRSQYLQAVYNTYSHVVLF